MEMTFYISENIKAYRTENSLSQAAFAKLLQVSPQAVSKWENGTSYPDLFILPRIAERLGVTMDELLFNKP